MRAAAILLLAAATLAAAPPDWAHPSAAEMRRALAAGFTTPQATASLLASDQGPYARLAWHDRQRRARALILTPPLRCAWEHGILYAAYGRAAPALADVAADCHGLAVLYIDSSAARQAEFHVELRVGGRRLAARVVRRDESPVPLRDERGRYYEFANLYLFDLPGWAAAKSLTVVFAGPTGRHLRRLPVAIFARDERRARAAAK